MAVKIMDCGFMGVLALAMLLFVPCVGAEPPSFEAGARGQGVRLGAATLLSYPEVIQHCDQAGTIECWFKLDQKATAYTDGTLFSAGTKQPDWTVMAVREGQLVFYRRKGKAPYEGPNAAWLKLACDIADLEPNVFHHAAVVWSVAPDGPALAQLYINGQRRAGEQAARILAFTEDGAELGVGYQTANARSPRFAGVIDELRVYNRPLVPDEITSRFRAVRSRGAEKKIAGVVCELRFEDKVLASRPKVKALSPQGHQKRHAYILKHWDNSTK